MRVTDRAPAQPDAVARPTVGERASAVGALISLVAAVGFSLIGIALHLLAILIVAAGLLDHGPQIVQS